MFFNDHLVLVRGGGDLATAVVYRLHQAGFPVIVTELARPLVVRREVAVATAVLQNQIQVENLLAQLVHSPAEALAMAYTDMIPVLISPHVPQPPLPISILVDGRMAKRNLDTSRDQASLVIALGPGFTAGLDCHAVIETMRGHTLGRVIWQGSALANTGTPGIVAGKGAERVLRAPTDGIVTWRFEIGDYVNRSDLIGHVAAAAVRAPFAGVLRGLIAPQTEVPSGLKIGDLDARGSREACFTMSDKALAIGGGVLEAVLTYINNRSQPEE